MTATAKDTLEQIKRERDQLRAAGSLDALQSLEMALFDLCMKGLEDMGERDEFAHEHEYWPEAYDALHHWEVFGSGRDNLIKTIAIHMRMVAQDATARERERLGLPDNDGPKSPAEIMQMTSEKYWEMRRRERQLLERLRKSREENKRLTDELQRLRAA